MDNATFQSLVDRDLHGGVATNDGWVEITDEERAVLRRPENLDRWRAELVQALRKVDHQLTASKSEITRKHRELRPRDPKRFAEFVQWRADWRARTMRFRSKIEEQLAENRALRQDRAEVPAALKTLITAIETHRKLAQHTTDVDVSVDETLWSVLDDTHVRSAAHLVGVGTG